MSACPVNLAEGFLHAQKTIRLWLHSQIQALCAIQRLNLAEWPVGHQLFKAVLESVTDENKADILAAAEKYDTIVRLARELGVKVASKYLLFYDLKTQIQKLNK